MNYIFISVILLSIIFIFCYYQNNKIDLTYYSIKNKFVKRKIKIIQLSDFHSKPFKAVLTKIENENPDYICITGDYINDRGKNEKEMLEYGKKLVKIAPVFYITGNHERRLDCFDALMKKLEDIGFIVLLNEIYTNDEITVLGLDENQGNFSDYKARKNKTFVYKDMSGFFNALKDYNNFKIVLSHFPENFEGIKELNYSQYDFDLQLSGHAHGGQWIMPFIGPLFSPGQGVLPKYARGSFGSRPKLIISRGLGNSEFPLRLFNHPEINIIEIIEDN